MDRTSTGIAAGRSRIWSQSTPRKNGINLSSSRPRFEPIRRSASQQNLIIVSFASSEMGVSGGNISVSRQFITLRYVSWGLSEQNGGYPISISYIITPSDHQSQAGPYPVWRNTLTFVKLRLFSFVWIHSKKIEEWGKTYFWCNVIGRTDGAVCQCTAVSLPTFRPSFRVHWASDGKKR